MSIAAGSASEADSCFVRNSAWGRPCLEHSRAQFGLSGQIKRYRIANGRAGSAGHRRFVLRFPRRREEPMQSTSGNFRTEIRMLRVAAHSGSR
jgi:hypothetical protein